MQTITVDWASDDAPEQGLVSGTDGDVLVIVQLEQAVGPGGGHPVYRVAAFAQHAPKYYEAMALDAWLRDVYGVEDDDERNDLLNA